MSLLSVLEFNGIVVGVAETSETIVLVCPDLAIKGGDSIVVGTNSSIARGLFQSCKTPRG